MSDPIWKTGSIDAYFDQLDRWLDLEAEAERERMVRRRLLRSAKDVEKTGEAIVNLKIVDYRTGLAGRFLIDFAKSEQAELPINRLKVGSPVVISDQNQMNDRGISGVVSRRKRDTIQVATETWPEAHRFRLDLSPDETTRRRQMSAMAKTRVADGRARKLRDILLGNQPPKFQPPVERAIVSNLNSSQVDAVQFVMSAQDVAVVHGPPGTGKTTTLAEIVFQAVAQGDRVLACAPSNTAVDNLLEKLVSADPIDSGSVIRVGHPARVFESLRGHTLDEVIDNDPSSEVIRDMRREVQDLVRTASKGFRGHNGRRRRGELFAEAGQLRGQIRALERSVLRSVLDGADVICTTTTIDDDLLGNRDFDLVVIDEACQCTLPGVWQAVLRANRIVFAGDHCQLPPTVLSDQAAREGMRESMMQHLVEREGNSIYRRLTQQYRMHERIMGFSSQAFYEDSLVADPSVRSHVLSDLSTVEVNADPSNDDQKFANPWFTQPLHFIDTAGAEYVEEIEPDGESKMNRKEAELTSQLVDELVSAGVDPTDIGVIAPYAAQVRWLRQQIRHPGLEIDTVDGFQGREKEAVVLTMVRSNDRQEIGFLRDTRRTNVAVTRARRCLIMIGDSATLASDPFYESLLEYFEQQGSYRSVWEMMGS
ncbi:MAG: AAA domain-containing protein [Planctomycetota bacterium]